MTIKELLMYGSNELKKTNIIDSLLKSRILLSYVIEKPKEYLIINQEYEIPKIQEEKYKQSITELIKGVPLQYITGHQEFMKLNFYVTPDVLIPQPDTEILVEEVMSISNDKKRVLDMCTGSGAIAISLAKYKDAWEITGADISSEALKVASKNAINNDVNVEFVLSDMFENINDKYDIIVSNPPYIKTEIISSLSMDVQHEPRIALDGGEDGLFFYRLLAKESTKYLAKGGILALEIGFDQAEAVATYLRKNYNEVYVKKDLENNDRVVIARI